MLNANTKVRYWDSVNKKLIYTTLNGAIRKGRIIGDLELWTGKIDADYKEIYEGDIITRIMIDTRTEKEKGRIKVYNASNTKDGKHAKIVQWDNHMNGWSWRQSADTAKNTRKEWGSFHSRYRIIGNIHEN